MSNREVNTKLLELADFVEKSQTFDMENWPIEAHCGTACCIGGHADLLFNVPRPNPNESRFYPVIKALGITAAQAEELFYMKSLDVDGAWGYEVYGGLVTPTMATRVIRHLAVTGTVDWSLVLAS